MNRIEIREVIVHAVEEILFVTLVMEDLKLRGIKKAPSVESINLDEIPPLLAAPGQIKAGRRRPESAIRAAHTAGRLGYSLSGARSSHNHQAGLATILGRRRAADDFDRLNRVSGNLVGKDLALLVGNRLAIHGEGIGGVVAEAVEEAV